MILAIDTSSRLGLVSLELTGGRRLGRVSEVPREHMSFLGRVLAELLEESGRSWEELERVAVTLGPGSFTGLRIGLASAKGLVFGRDLPLAPLPSLALPACAHPEWARRPLLLCRPARGKELWAARFRPGTPEPEWESLLDPGGLIAEAEALAEVEPAGRVVGSLPDAALPELASLAIDEEPAAAAQLEVLARLARETEHLVSGPDLDRLLPRYLLAPAITRPKPEAGRGGGT